MKRESADKQLRHLVGESVIPQVAADETPRKERWSRPVRFLFIVVAAIACWALPIGVVLLVIR